MMQQQNMMALQMHHAHGFGGAPFHGAQPGGPLGVEAMSGLETCDIEEVPDTA